MGLQWTDGENLRESIMSASDFQRGDLKDTFQGLVDGLTERQAQEFKHQKTVDANYAKVEDGANKIGRIETNQDHKIALRLAQQEKDKKSQQFHDMMLMIRRAEELLAQYKEREEYWRNRAEQGREELSKLEETANLLEGAIDHFDKHHEIPRNENGTLPDYIEEAIQRVEELKGTEIDRENDQQIYLALQSDLKANKSRQDFLMNDTVEADQKADEYHQEGQNLQGLIDGAKANDQGAINQLDNTLSMQDELKAQLSVEEGTKVDETAPQELDLSAFKM